MSLTWLQGDVYAALKQLGGLPGGWHSVGSIAARLGVEGESGARRVSAALGGLRSAGHVDKHPNDTGWWRLTSPEGR
jgi:hypothetical protein